MTLGKGGVDSGPGSHGVPELVQTDGPGFSLCAVPLELSGPGFCGKEQGLGERCGFTLRKVPLVCMQRSSCRRYVTHLFEGRDFS